MLKQIGKTALAMGIIMVFYFVAGASVVVNSLEGTQAKLSQGIFIWLSVMAVVLFYLIRFLSIADLGFHKVREGSIRELLYQIPMLVVALLGLSGGVNFSHGGSFLFASLFLTIGVGLSEEIYFRGIICKLWMAHGSGKAIWISSILFGICHLLNILGGAGVGATILQIFFAFFYGAILAVIFIRTQSIVPCILLHFLHDFCSFIAKDISQIAQIGVGVTQTLLLLFYLIFLVRNCKSKWER